MKLSKKVASSLILFLGMATQVIAQSKLIELVSPNSELKVSINLSDKIYYSIAGAARTY